MDAILSNSYMKVSIGIALNIPYFYLVQDLNQ